MADSSLGAVAELLKLFTGKGNTTTTKDYSDGFTETTQKGLPPEAMQALIKTAMEGSQGLAAVAGGQKSAGLYNSSTNQLLVNDLLARITGQAATLGAPTTVTRSPTSRTQTQSVQSPALKNSLPALAGMSLGKGGIDELLGYGNKASSGYSLFKRGKDLVDWLSATESAIPQGAISAANASADPIGSLYTLTGGFSDVAPAASQGISGLDFADTVSSIFSYPSVEAVNAGGELAFTSAASESVAEAGSSLYASTATEASIDAGALGGDAIGSYGTAELGAAAFGAEAAIGAEAATSLAAAGGVIEGGFATGGAALGATAAAEGIGAAAGGAVAAEAAGAVAAEAVAAEAASVEILPVIATALAWVICTELNHRGELSDTLYQATSPHFSRMHPDTIRGYQWWAIPYVKLMRKHSLFRAVVRPWAIGRARYLSGESSILGWVTVAIGEPICFLLGKTVARKSQDYEVLYGR